MTTDADVDAAREAVIAKAREALRAWEQRYLEEVDDLMEELRAALDVLDRGDT